MQGIGSLLRNLSFIERSRFEIRLLSRDYFSYIAVGAAFSRELEVGESFFGGVTGRISLCDEYIRLECICDVGVSDMNSAGLLWSLAKKP